MARWQAVVVLMVVVGCSGSTETSKPTSEKGSPVAAKSIRPAPANVASWTIQDVIAKLESGGLKFKITKKFPGSSVLGAPPCVGILLDDTFDENEIVIRMWADEKEASSKAFFLNAHCATFGRFTIDGGAEDLVKSVRAALD